ncbi:hypothetical protein UFOVP67_25 [uncultured Caudovirales phage]|uniref:Uncharacterized protein n=1 Tax=uncultured Caudovirales phage TaxID=2100421 RepID=A0A6J5T928_9CAUD|nr:hypothetical protein UFOVP67_25 [uncultured Caudovirales phage]
MTKSTGKTQANTKSSGKTLKTGSKKGSVDLPNGDTHLPANMMTRTEKGKVGVKAKYTFWP